ncbi:MAG: hypothetical protein H0V66_08495, partial [Bdellovibrionales bacterium]|nr:hypothetical protein [Bdellovibrionales bacterium]
SSDLGYAEKNLDKKKKSLLNFVASDKSGINEQFVDELANDTNKEMLFGSSEIDPSAEDTKGQFVAALDKKVFDKGSYGLLKDKAEEYQALDRKYQEKFEGVADLKKRFNLDAPSLTIVSPSQLIKPDESLVKREPSNDVVVDAVVREEKKEEVIEDKVLDEIIIPQLDPIDEKTVVVDPVIDQKDAPLVIPELEPEVKPDVVVKKDECKVDDEDCKEEEAIVTKEVVPVVETPEELCRKEAVAKIMELFKDDKQNILGQQFNLTAMKTALYLKGKAAPGSVPVSLEQSINKDQASLTKDEKIVELKKIYADHGMDGAGAGMEEMVTKMKQQKFNYFSSASRMSNDEASKMYLLLSKGDSAVKFGMEDAAVAWAFGQMNKFEPGSAQSNKMSLSTHVNKMMSTTIAGGTNISVEKLEAASKEAEKAIDDAIAVSLKSISEECQKMFPEGCLVIGDVKQDAFAGMIKAILDKQVNKMDEKEVAGFHVQAKSFLGHPSEADYLDLGQKKLKKEIPAFSPESLKKVQIAAGKTVLSRKEQALKLEGKCYLTKYEAGKIGVIESVCK